MERFSLLMWCGILLTSLAVLVLLGGILAALGTATTVTWRGETEFKFGTFLGTFLACGAVAFGLAVSAEVIRLFLAIEEHLCEMRVSLSGLASAAETSVQSVEQEPAQLPPTRGSATRTREVPSGPPTSRLGTFDPPSDD